MATQSRPLFDRAIVGPALIESLKKLNPAHLWKNPVMFVTEVGAALTTFDLCLHPSAFVAQVAAWLWFTVALRQLRRGDGRGARQGPGGHLAQGAQRRAREEARPRRATRGPSTLAAELRKGDLVVVEAGDLIPMDGEVLEGVASVDESAITGESAPVIRESGGDRSAVTGGTRVLSDWLVVEVSTNPGETFLDRMIAMVEGAKRQKTPNEIALDILLAALTIVFLLATRDVVTLLDREPYARRARGRRSRSPSSSRCSSASSRRRSAGCSPRSASPAWTG